MAQVNGFAARAELAGHQDSASAVTNFFTMLTHGHSWVTGGSNDNEAWGEPGELGNVFDKVCEIPNHPLLPKICCPSGSMQCHKRPAFQGLSLLQAECTKISAHLAARVQLIVA